MALDPTLIIQMQRLGDLVMAFPLMAWLRQMEPERPVWVVAEPIFYEALMAFAPNVVFFEPPAATRLKSVRFRRIINLSHREEARALAAQARTDFHYGAYKSEEGLHIEGRWHLYRASIVHNNRHNRFHWSDLAALDVIPHIFLPHTRWPVPRVPDRNGRGRIGLFVGASEPDKRPTPAFWSQLAIHLIRRGLEPVFLGGKQERALAGEAARLSRIPRSNLAGIFSLEKFADFIGKLDLLVTPDTGPMHVGAWMRTPTLNLSMGPVNPWETAPAVPGHLVLRAEPSCAGCWHCTRPRINNAPPCHVPFIPKRISAIIQTLMHNRAFRLELPGLHLYRTSRDDRGLFTLEAADTRKASARDLLGNFWREMFLYLLDGPESHVESALEALKADGERHIPLLVRHTTTLVRHLALRHKDAQLWLSVPPLMRPFSSYANMVWDNENRSQQARDTIMQLSQRLLERLIET